MIYVIKTENNDVIVFDSVTSFSESYQGSVTSHPVEDGSKISDHVITNNTKLKISGVVSDFNFFNPLKDFANESVPYYKYDRSASISTLNVAGSFEEGSSKDVPQDYSGNDDNGSFSVKASAETVKKKLLDIFKNKREVTVLAYGAGSNNNIESFPSCVITDISFDVNPESGYALYPNISLEQVTRVLVKVVQADAEKLTPAMSDKGTEGNGKGKTEAQAKKNVTDEKKASTKSEIHVKLIEILEGAESSAREAKQIYEYAASVNGKGVK